MKSKNIRLYVAIIVFTIGTVVPFIDYLVLIAVFILIIPLSLLFLGSAAYLLISLIDETIDRTRAIYFACLVPLYFAGQFISTYSVNKIQRYRSEIFIQELNSE